MVGKDASYYFAYGFVRGIVKVWQDAIFLDNRREMEKNNKVMNPVHLHQLNDIS